MMALLVLREVTSGVILTFTKHTIISVKIRDTNQIISLSTLHQFVVLDLIFTRELDLHCNGSNQKLIYLPGSD